MNGIVKLKRVAVTGLATLGLIGAVASPVLAHEFPEEARAGLAWAKTQQQPDGSFSGFGAGSTVDVLLATIPLSVDPDTLSVGGNTPIAFLESKAAELAKTPGGAGKLAIAVGATGRDPKAFGGTDLLAAINSTYDTGTNQYGKDAIGHAFAILGLHFVGADVPQAAVDRLRSLQGPEGGWAFTGETTPKSADTNTTAIAVQALLARGESAEGDTLKRAMAFLLSQQNEDGGFPYQKEGEFGGESDVNSSAYVAQAFLALGDHDTADRAKEYIRGLQKPNGAFQWKQSEPDDNAGATYQAIPVLMDATLVNPSGILIATGMPIAGNAEWSLVGALTAFSALMLALGIAARRRAFAS